MIEQVRRERPASHRRMLARDDSRPLGGHDGRMDLGLDGRVFLVTGGSRGLGLAAAAALVSEGARVLVVARDEATLARATAELGTHDRVVGLSGDLADPAIAERAVAATIAHFGRLDGCLLSTGGPPAGTVMSTNDTEWRDAFETLVLGPLRLARAVAAAATESPGLHGTGGAILFVLSTSVFSPIPGLSISNALRPGLAMVVKDLAAELGNRGIRVNGIAPGRFATDRVFALDARSGTPENIRRRNETTIPLGRYGEPDEFGRLAAMLLSPACSYVSGTVVVADGGALR